MPVVGSPQRHGEEGMKETKEIEGMEERVGKEGIRETKEIEGIEKNGKIKSPR